MNSLARSRAASGARSLRPTVVEHLGSPQSTSDGRTTRSAVAPHGAPAMFPTDTVTNGGLRQQALRFAAIGLVSTLAWAGLYALLRGAGLGSVAANALALVVTAIGNTAANRRLTFGVRGRDGLARDHGAGLLAFSLALGLTTTAATLLDRLAPGAHRLVEIAVLSAANVAATVGRFVLLRAWIGRASPGRATPGRATPGRAT